MSKHFGRLFIEWIFRRRSTGLTLVQIGVGLLAGVALGLTVGVTIPTPHGPLTLNWDSAGSGDTISWSVFGIAVLLTLLGIVLIILETRQDGRKKVIVIEARGLRDWQGQALSSAVPATIKGRREQILVDLRQGVIDGQIVSPQAALRHLESLPADIARRCSGLDRSDISFVISGLAPVPFLFLLGVIVDDESETFIMDWDRTEHAWRALSDEDDGKRFKVTGLDTVNANEKRVALCVSASYDVLESDVRIVETGVPIVKLELVGRNTISHWSEEKQQQLAQQFLHTVMDLTRQGVTEISLFLAAPASLALRLGTIYDKRNMPSVEVNQYERNDPKKFPWAVRMPVAGLCLAELNQR